MNALTGTPRLLRLALRRDRLLVPAWLVVIGVLAAAITYSVVGLYTTEQERVAAATFGAANTVARVFDGPASGTELGAMVLTEGYWLLAVLTAFLCAQATVRHTRLDEETGRAELVGAAVVGRYARLVAALLLASVAAVLAGGVVTGVLLSVELGLAGSLLAGLTVTGNGLVFAAVAATAAQVASSARAANGATAGVIGVAWLLRAIGDALGEVGEGGVRVVSAWPSWLSPIGWGQQARAFEAEHWAVLGLFAATLVVLVPVALALVTRRDLGAGLVPPRPGPARAAGWLGSPLGLAWRLQRAPLAAWTVAMAVIGAAFGVVGESADELLEISGDLAAALEGLGTDATVVELYFAFTVGFLAIAASGFVVQALLRLRTEELGGRSEALLATALSRGRWLGAHVAIAAGGTLVLLTAMGGAGAVGYGVATGEWREGVEGLLGSAVAHAPATFVLGAVVVLAVTWVPRAAAAIGWAVFVLSLVFGQVGALLDLPQAVLDVSPFTHVPALPAEPIAWLPLVTLTAVAALLTAAGFVGWRRRDLVVAS